MISKSEARCDRDDRRMEVRIVRGMRIGRRIIGNR